MRAARATRVTNNIDTGLDNYTTSFWVVFDSDTREHLLDYDPSDKDLTWAQLQGLIDVDFQSTERMRYARALEGIDRISARFLTQGAAVQASMEVLEILKESHPGAKINLQVHQVDVLDVVAVDVGQECHGASWAPNDDIDTAIDRVAALSTEYGSDDEDDDEDEDERIDIDFDEEEDDSEDRRRMPPPSAADPKPKKKSKLGSSKKGESKPRRRKQRRTANGH